MSPVNSDDSSGDALSGAGRPLTRKEIRAREKLLATAGSQRDPAAGFRDGTRTSRRAGAAQPRSRSAGAPDAAAAVRTAARLQAAVRAGTSRGGPRPCMKKPCTTSRCTKSPCTHEPVHEEPCTKSRARQSPCHARLSRSDPDPRRARPRGLVRATHVPHATDAGCYDAGMRQRGHGAHHDRLPMRTRHDGYARPPRRGPPCLRRRPTTTTPRRTRKPSTTTSPATS